MTPRFRHAHWAAPAFALACCTLSAHSQTVTASVTGVVTDTSGAVIPNAKVVVTNVATGVITTATTDSSGAYTIRFLPIGRYSEQITASGFAPQQVPAFQLEIAQAAKIDGHLQNGDLQTTVEVTSQAPILNTNDASLGISLDTNEIANIPLNGRNFSSVTLFEPGAINTDPASLNGNNAIERETYNSGTVSVNGNRNQANYYTLDGADQNEPQNNLIAYNPAPDALAEVRVVSANAPAQFGNANGGAVVSVLKSGSNQSHGSAYGYLENYNLDANSWVNKQAFPIIPKNPYTQSIFGGTIGGPVLHNKLFFFADYEGVRKHTGGTQQASVLPQAFRNGDFSSLLPGIQLYNSQAGFAPYTNNQVPVNNPVAKFLFAHPELYPLPNASPTSGSIFKNNYQGPTRTFVRNDQGDVKIEYDLGTRDKLTAFFSQSDASDGQTSVIPITFPAQNVYPTKLGGGSWIHTFNPAVVNEARFGFTRVRWDNGVPTDPSGDFGTRGNQVVGIPFGTQTYPGFSGQSLTGSDASYFGTQGAAQILRDNTFNYYDNLTIQLGKHLLSTGVQFTRYQQNYLNTSTYGFLGEFIYTGSFTGLPGSTGYSPADFDLDQVSETQLGSTLGLVGNRQWRSAGYFQDDWKVNDRLTVNLGIRYEYDQPWTEQNNKTANVLLATGQVEYAGSVPAGAPAGSIVCPTPACYNGNWTQIMPRIGFAYQVTPRFVVRGGYGATSFFEGDDSNQRLTSSPPFSQGQDSKATLPSAGNGGTPFSTTNGFTGSFGAVNPQYSVWPQNQQPAYIHNFNLTTEYALTNTTSLQLTYLGETGHHLADYRNANQLTTTQAQAIAASETMTVNPPQVAPYAGLVGQNGTLLVTESSAMMNYNGGQATIRQRATRGLEFTFNYTYGRAMTNSSGNFAVSGISGSDGAYQDGYNGSLDYGPSPQDIRNSVNGVVVYSLPVGRGQEFGAHMNPFLDLVVGGWKGSATLVAYSGYPITINGPGGTSNTNSEGQMRANFYRPLHVVNRGLNHWFGTDPTAVGAGGAGCASQNAQALGCAYGPAAPNTFGTASVNSERAPGFRQADLSAFKDFHITERQQVGFRTDFFNAFNITSYNNPDNTITDTGFGNITTVRDTARQIQFSAHYQF